MARRGWRSVKLGSTWPTLCTPPVTVTTPSWALPIDNEHVRGISIVAWPLENGEPKPDWKPGTDTIADIRPGSFLKRTYEERQRKPDDLETQEGQRAIAIHALENLAHSDSGVVMLRLLEATGTEVRRLPAGGGSLERTRLKKPEIPASREFTGTFIDSRLRSGSMAAKKGVTPDPYEPIPYASEQGIFGGLAGNLNWRSGRFPP